MTEFYEHRGTWASLPLIVQGIFEDGECTAIKVIDATDGKPISWAFDPENVGGPKSNTRESFVDFMQKLYDKKDDLPANEPMH